MKAYLVREWIRPMRRDWWFFPAIAVVMVVAALSGCVAVPVEPAPVVAISPVPSPANPAYVKELEKFRAETIQRRHPDVDKTIQTVTSCAQLFARGSDGERLCLMRGMDRYVDHMTPPISERYVPVPQPVLQPPAAVVVPAPPNGSALIDCRIDPRPPCYIPNIAPPHSPRNGGPG